MPPRVFACLGAARACTGKFVGIMGVRQLSTGLPTWFCNMLIFKENFMLFHKSLNFKEKFLWADGGQTVGRRWAQKKSIKIQVLEAIQI